jgi:hypothetical protein
VCAPVAVPPIFVWRDVATDTAVLALFHGLGYGVAADETQARQGGEGRRMRRRDRSGELPDTPSMDENRDSFGQDPAKIDAGAALRRIGITAATCDCTTAPLGCPCANNPLTDVYIDTNGDAVMKASAAPYDDGPGMHVNPDGTVHAERFENCVDVEAAGVALCYAWKVGAWGVFGGRMDGNLE